jgi:transcriptional regulator with XRE-family HTH domain
MKSETGDLLAGLVNELFATRRAADGSMYSNADVVRALAGRLTASYLTKLRHGEIENPTRDTLLALCEFFQVEPSYFFPDFVLDAGAQRHVVYHSTKVSPELQQKLDELYELMRQQKQE